MTEESPINIKLISTEEAFKILGLSPRSGANWRVKGKGPRWVKIGRRIFYPANELETWIRKNIRSSTSEKI